MAYILFVLSPFLYSIIWILVCWAIIKYLLKPKNKNPETKTIRISVGTVLLVAWIVWPFWEVIGKILYYDAQVDEMCAKDGGIKVYEMVTMSPGQYENYVKKNWILPDESKMTNEDDYYVTRDKHYYAKGQINVSRRHYKIIRKIDKKILGEMIIYGRGGGDIPGPWEPSSYSCPRHNELINFESSVFKKGVTR